MPSVGIMKWLVLRVISLLYFGFENGAHAVPVRQINDGNAFYYLLQYGYISSTENDKASLMSADVITKAVKDFQVPISLFIPSRARTIVVRNMKKQKKTTLSRSLLK